MVKKYEKYTIGTHFLAARFQMLTSKAHEDLSPVARLILNFLEIEYARSNGYRNGRLIAPMRRLTAFCRVGHATIADGISELRFAGFIKFKKGLPGPKGKGRSMLFGLTYAPTVVEKGRDGPAAVIPPTDEWDTTGRVASAKSRRRNQAKINSYCASPSTIDIVLPQAQDTPDYNLAASKEVPVKSILGVLGEAQDIDIYPSTGKEMCNRKQAKTRDEAVP